MKIKEALEIGIGCGLETVGECVYNIELHAPSLFSYGDLPKELNELRTEESELYKSTSFTKDSNVNDVIKVIEESKNQPKTNDVKLSEDWVSIIERLEDDYSDDERVQLFGEIGAYHIFWLLKYKTKDEILAVLNSDSSRYKNGERILFKN